MVAGRSDAVISGGWPAMNVPLVAVPSFLCLSVEMERVGERNHV